MQGAVAVGCLLAGCGVEDALGIPAPPADATSTTGSTAATDRGEATGAPVTSSSDAADETGEPRTAAQIYAVARCDALAACTCPTMPFANTDECRASLENVFLGLQDRFATAQTDFDCFDAIVAFYESSDCETPLDIALASLAPACALLADTGAIEEPCARASFTSFHADSCAEGSRCVATLTGLRCRPDGDDAHVLSEGQVCVGRDASLGTCESGTWCDTLDSDTCRVRAELGQACLAHSGCQSGWCDDASDPAVCAERLPPGSRCTVTAACAAPTCTDGICDRPLCANGVCQDGVPQACISEDL